MGTEQRMVVAKGPGLKLGFLVPTVNFSFTVLVTTMKVMKNICCCVTSNSSVDNSRPEFELSSISYCLTQLRLELGFFLSFKHLNVKRLTSFGFRCKRFRERSKTQRNRSSKVLQNL